MKRKKQIKKDKIKKMIKSNKKLNKTTRKTNLEKRKKSELYSKIKVIDSYSYDVGGIKVKISINDEPKSFIPIYNVQVPTISKTTDAVLEQIKADIIDVVDVSVVDVMDSARAIKTHEKFQHAIEELIKKYFPEVDKKTLSYLTTYIVQKSLGLGDIDTLMGDNNLEEIAINGSKEPIWVYHRIHGWLKTTLMLKSEEEIRQLASVIGRKVGRQINVLSPLMDANLQSGHRVNATLTPISSRGNTITLRKFSSKPWTITDLILSNTLTIEMAAIIWEAIHYELSILIAGGTASGKTSFLNAITQFFPSNQRIISIEDTREVQLPSFAHWIPMTTRLPNAEGRGEVSMSDLLVNSLRMRPDRVIVGEVRRQREAEVLFEAIHTGHSVYATVHANSAEETITRLTNPPIQVPKAMINALDLIIVQYRNRRTGKRRTFQIAEITKEGETKLIAQYNAKTDKLEKVGNSNLILKKLQLFTGVSLSELKKEIKKKENVLKFLVKNKIDSVDEVGKKVAELYKKKYK